MLAPLVAAAASFACDPSQRMRTTPSASSFRGNTLLIRVRAPPRMMCANPEPAEQQANAPPSSPSAMPSADTSPGEVVCDDDGCYLMLDTVSDGLVDTAIPIEDSLPLQAGAQRLIINPFFEFASVFSTVTSPRQT